MGRPPEGFPLNPKFKKDANGKKNLEKAGSKCGAMQKPQQSERILRSENPAEVYSIIMKTFLNALFRQRGSRLLCQERSSNLIN